MISRILTGKGTFSFLVLCLVVAAVGVEAASGDRLVYRYVTPDGKIVVTDSPLPEHAVYGYDVIDPNTDKVIRRVSPQQSANAYATQQARRRALEECQDELRLLRYRYASVKDIEISRDSNLGAIDHRVTVIRSELTRADTDLEDNLRRAAEGERAGQGVSTRVSDNIARLRDSIASLGAELEQKLSERPVVVARYERETERYLDGTCDFLEDDW